MQQYAKAILCVKFRYNYFHLLFLSPIIITLVIGGTNAGVMKHVGEAVQQRGSVANIGRSKINVIGVAPWGVINNNSRLTSKVC